jgi:hypothetical protein
MRYTTIEPADQARFDAIPALGAFVQEVTRVIKDEPDSFWECEAAFRELVRSPTLLHDLVRYEIERLRRDVSYVARESTESRIALLTLPHVELGLVHIEPREDVEAVTHSIIGDHAMIGSLGPGTLRMQQLRHSSPVRTDVFDPSRALDMSEEIEVRPGETRGFRAGVDAIFERAPLGPACMMLFVYRYATPIRWIFDAASRLPTRAVSTDHQTYRMDFAARTLARMGYTPAASTLEDLYRHPAHFVRWAAVRELVLLDPERGLKLLERASEDPHPHVRNAARRSLENLAAAQTKDGPRPPSSI